MLGSRVTVEHWHLKTAYTSQCQASTTTNSKESMSLSFVGESQLIYMLLLNDD